MRLYEAGLSIVSIRVREFRLGNAVIRGRTFGVGHEAIQSYPKWGTAIRSALFRIIRTLASYEILLRLEQLDYYGKKIPMSRFTEKMRMNSMHIINKNDSIYTLCNIPYMKINISLVDHYNQWDGYVKCPLENEPISF